MTTATEHVFVARQPIFDRERTVHGYELLYRTGFLPLAQVEDGEVATARVALNALTEVGWDRLIGDKTAWLNVTAEFVIHRHALSLPADRVVLELVLEPGDAASEADLLDRLGELRDAGFKLALTSTAPAAQLETLRGLVEIIKLDYAALGSDGLLTAASQLRPLFACLVAEKIETHEAFELACEAGCDLFQGYFFCRPQLLRDRAITPTAVALLSLASALQDPALELSELERLISSDVALSYRLLCYINSAFFGMRHRVASLKHAITLLGIESVRRWAALTTFAMVADKPTELYLTALTRARFCQLAGQSEDGAPDQLFTLGLFSVIDALTDTSMEAAVDALPLPPRLRNALVNRAGPGRLLTCVEALERGQFDRVARQLAHPARDYTNALAWATTATAGMQLKPDATDDPNL